MVIDFYLPLAYTIAHTGLGYSQTKMGLRLDSAWGNRLYFKIWDISAVSSCWGPKDSQIDSQSTPPTQLDWESIQGKPTHVSTVRMGWQIKFTLIAVPAAALQWSKQFSHTNQTKYILNTRGENKITCPASPLNKMLRQMYSSIPILLYYTAILHLFI